MAYSSVEHKEYPPEAIKVISESTSGEFQGAINDALRFGWRPYGSLAIYEGKYVMLMAKYSAPSYAGPY